jgi:hypothetical protein
MTDSDEIDHQRDLLAAHLRRLAALDEQLARKPGDVGLRMERDQAAAGAEQAAAQLGLGTLRDNLAAIVDAVELRADYCASLQRQHQDLAAYRRAAELQRVNADALARIDLDQALQGASTRLERTVRELGELGVVVPPSPEPALPHVDIYASYEHGLRELKRRTGPDSAAYPDVLLYEQRLTENLAQTRRYGDTEARRADRAAIIDQLNALARAVLGTTFNELCAQPAPLPRASDPPRGLDSARAARLRDLLRRCDEHFDTNSDLRALFAEPRLVPWRGGLPEAGSLNARVDRLIDYLREKRTSAGEQVLVLLLQVLAERYGSADGRYGELKSLASEI